MEFLISEIEEDQVRSAALFPIHTFEKAVDEWNVKSIIVTRIMNDQ
ncbi:2052_t:CDS:2 [Entrophospora sp. SA101]|nr:2052_t:CDS:2 [Entrophospora sp. SA101]